VQAAIADVTRMSGSSAMKSMRAAVNLRIRARKAIKLKEISSAISIGYPTGKGALAWRMRVKGAPAALYGSYSVNETKTGLSVKVNASAPRKRIKHAFVATMKSGHKGAFIRFGPKTGEHHRQRIKELFTTRVKDLFVDADMVPALYNTFSVEFVKNMKRLVPLRLAHAVAR
jgi:hypothetical protein